MLKFQLFLSLVFTGIATFSWSQLASHDDLFENFEFRKFIEAKEDNPSKQKDYLQLAQAHYYLNEFEVANSYFSKLNWEEEDLEFVSHLYYANSLKNTGKISEAKSEVNVYLKEFPKDAQAILLLKQIENYSSANQILKSKIILSNSKEINSSTAQFSPIYNEEKLYFISELKVSKSNNLNVEFDDKNSTDLAYGLNVRPHSVLQLVIEGEENQLFKAFEKYNVGASCYNSIDKEWLLTLTPQEKKWQNQHQVAPRIYTWKESSGAPKKLKLKGIKAAIGCGHPALSADGKYLVFAVDKGKNGSDLYISKKQDQNWSKPKLFSKQINTIKDEVYPVFEGDSILYFSSDGHLGIGGLDIYKVRFNQGVLEGEPQLLGKPFNTESDDYSLVFSDEKKTEGFLVSDRRGGEGDADIYFFNTQIPWKFKLQIQNESGLIVENKEVQLKVNGISKQITNPTTGKLEQLEIDANSLITFNFSHADSLINKEFRVPNTNGKDTLLIVIVTDKKVILELNPNNQTSQESISETPKNNQINSIYFDFNKFTFNKNFEHNLKDIVVFLKENTDKQIIVKTLSDERGNILYNLDLTTKRAKEIFKFLVKNGINPNRIKLQSLGEAIYDEKCSPNCDESIHSKYRRADFEIR